MSWLLGLLAIPLTIFILFVVPIWLWLHYRGKQGDGGQLNQQDMQRLVKLTEEAQRMRDRIQALEAILDEEHPNWRQR
ncbi:envelope stress response membrane protein PspB [Limnobaculum parvum]|uniref:Envelope stress response membrane protein PspB n=1 Tax=Limnobaculum parvum TaxID=2172103 RepID=A0A2Y9TUI3_9GAMM|nr:envelope stress response membrane protein PspB [Limnobaculum parvum]AWH87368.1 envelope stress response membrane protein PspB [Limnobaculum parvum]